MTRSLLTPDRADELMEHALAGHPDADPLVTSLAALRADLAAGAAGAAGTPEPAPHPSAELARLFAAGSVPDRPARRSPVRSRAARWLAGLGLGAKLALGAGVAVAAVGTVGVAQHQHLLPGPIQRFLDQHLDGPADSAPRHRLEPAHRRPRPAHDVRPGDAHLHAHPHEAVGDDPAPAPAPTSGTPAVAPTPSVAGGVPASGGGHPTASAGHPTAHGGGTGDTGGADQGDDPAGATDAGQDQDVPDDGAGQAGTGTSDDPSGAADPAGGDQGGDTDPDADS